MSKNQSSTSSAPKPTNGGGNHDGISKQRHRKNKGNKPRAVDTDKNESSSTVLGSRPAVASLPLLQYPTDDVEQWIRAMKPYCARHFGMEGAFIDAKDYPGRYRYDPPKVMWTDDNDPSGTERERAKLKLKEEHTQEMEALKNKQQLVQFFFGQMIVRSEEVVRGHPDFKPKVTLKDGETFPPESQWPIISDPLKVLNIIRSTHKVGDISSKVVAEREFKYRFNKAFMSEGEDIHTFRRRYLADYENLKSTIEPSEHLSERALCNDFIGKLHRGRYASLLNRIDSDQRLNPSSYPTTIEEVVRICEQFRFGQLQPKFTTATVFKVTTDTSVVDERKPTASDKPTGHGNGHGSSDEKKASHSAASKPCTQDANKDPTAKPKVPVCGLCDEEGHKFYKCPQLSVAKKSLKKNAKVSVMTLKENDDYDFDEESTFDDAIFMAKREPDSDDEDQSSKFY